MYVCMQYQNSPANGCRGLSPGNEIRTHHRTVRHAADNIPRPTSRVGDIKASMFPVHLKLVKNGNLQRLQWKKYRKMQGRINEQWDSIKAGEKQQTSCANTYGPNIEL